MYEVGYWLIDEIADQVMKEEEDFKVELNSKKKRDKNNLGDHNVVNDAQVIERIQILQSKTLSTHKVPVVKVVAD